MRFEIKLKVMLCYFFHCVLNERGNMLLGPFNLFYYVIYMSQLLNNMIIIINFQIVQQQFKTTSVINNQFSVYQKFEMHFLTLSLTKGFSTLFNTQLLFGRLTLMDLLLQRPTLHWHIHGENIAFSLSVNFQ